MNALTHLHDIYCDCYNPLTHTAAFILEKEKDLKFSTPEKQILQQCLTGEGRTEDTPGTDDVIQQGDLDALFEQPFTEEDTDG